MTNGDCCPHVVGESSRLTETLTMAAGFLFGFDYDGTLSPIVENPEEATLPDSVEQPLRTLASRNDVQVAIVSGRELQDLRERVGISEAIYAGNHGLELYRDGEDTVQGVTEQHQSRLDEISVQLRSKVADIPGCSVEDKGATITVHVRQASLDVVEKVRDIVDGAVEDKPALHVTTGKQVFEIRPVVDHDKGTTMERLRSERPADWATVYLGDDTTDEDAFETIQPEGIGIHVGTNTETAAAYRIPTQRDVPAFLQWLTTTVSKSAH